MRCKKLRNIADELANLAENLPDTLAKLVQNAYNKLRDEFDTALSNETARIAAEQERKDAEKERKDAEQERKDADMARRANVASRNLLNVTFCNGYLSDGKFVEGDKKNPNNETEKAPNVSFSEYIKVAGGKTYTFSWSSCDYTNASLWVKGYDSDKANINCWKGLDMGNLMRFSFPDECAYIRFHIQTNVYTSDVTWKDLIPKDFQLELGEDATPYVQPMVTDNTLIDDIALAQRMIKNDKCALSENKLRELIRTVINEEMTK